MDIALRTTHILTYIHLSETYCKIFTGAPCEVLSSSKTTIKCRTSHEPANLKDMDLHPGMKCTRVSRTNLL